MNHGEPVPATISFSLYDEETWIVGVHDDVYLKMVKLRVTGANSFVWIHARYAPDGSYDESCLNSFVESCFDGNDVPETKYQVQLVAVPMTVSMIVTKSIKLKMWHKV